MKWLDATKGYFGLGWADRLSFEDCDPNDLHDPYNEGVKALKAGKDKEFVVDKLGAELINEAIYAEQRMNGLGEIDWHKILIRSKQAYEEGIFLERAGRKRQDGKEIDLEYLEKLVDNQSTNGTNGYKKLGEVETIETPLIKCGYYPIDYHLGGIPIGLITLGGRPKVGKSTFAIRIAGSMVLKYKKHVLFHSLEMRDSEIKLRFREIFGKHYDEIEPYILVDHEKIPAREIKNRTKEAQKQFKDQLCFSVIDSVDKTLEGKISEQEMSDAYDQLVAIPKIVNTPTLVIAHLLKTSSGVPRPKDLRYSRMATADAAWVAMLYNPNTDDTVDAFSEFDSDTPLSTIKNQAYIISWMTRFGVKSHPNSKASENHPGAMRVPYHPVRGWLSKKQAPWHSLQNSL